MAFSAPTPRAERCSGNQTATTARRSWFDHVLGPRAIIESARTLAGMAAVNLTCEPGDIRPTGRVYHLRDLRSRHLAVLLRKGRTMRSPDRDLPDKRRDLQDRRAGLVSDDRAPRPRRAVA